MKPPTFAHRLEYALFRGTGALLRALPERTALRAGGALGSAIGSLLRIRRKVVDRNLLIAFPEQSDEWRRRIADAAYRHLGREGAALFCLQEMTPAELLERCEIEGIELVQESIAEGKGVLIFSGHLGNWELLALILSARGLPLDAVAHVQANPLFDANVQARRGRFGMRVIPRSEGTWKVLRSLQGGRTVLLFADQRVISGDIQVEYFGVPSATARGPAVFALRTGATVVTAMIRALPGAEARYRVQISPLLCERTGTQEDDVRALTRAYLAAMEEAIREAPEQYFWLHNRWKGYEQVAKPLASGDISDFPADRAGTNQAESATRQDTSIGDPP